MKSQTLRRLLFIAPALVASANGSWSDALILTATFIVAGVALERRLRSWFEADVSFFATLALLTSATVTKDGQPDLARALMLLASSLAFVWLSGAPLSPRLLWTLAAGLAIAPAVVELLREPDRVFGLEPLLVALFGASGRFYGAPLLWAGVIGLGGLKTTNPGLTRLALAAIVPGTLSLLLGTHANDPTVRTVTWLPFFLPGLAECFRRIRERAARRPVEVVAVAGALLALWNGLFMEQYRERLLPSDDTVSFARVTSNSASLLSRAVGTPAAWPANWLFAARFRTTPDRWDAIAGHHIFETETSGRAVVEVGDDASVFSADTALFLDGFGSRRTCERGWCRDLDGEGRLLLPLPWAGRRDLIIRMRVRGQGAITIALDRTAVVTAEMTDSLSDVSLRVPARAVRPGIKVLSLSVAGGGRATIDRLTLERGDGVGSTR